MTKDKQCHRCKAKIFKFYEFIDTFPIMPEKVTICAKCYKSFREWLKYSLYDQKK